MTAAADGRAITSRHFKTAASCTQTCCFLLRLVSGTNAAMHAHKVAVGPAFVRARATVGDDYRAAVGRACLEFRRCLCRFWR
jgi:hypothetical protein